MHFSSKRVIFIRIDDKNKIKCKYIYALVQCGMRVFIRFLLLFSFLRSSQISEITFDDDDDDHVHYNKRK